MQKIYDSWGAAANFREMRARCKRYAYGRQWDDIIDVNGEKMREADYIRLQGSVPMKNNLIRKLVRSVLGVYRNRQSFPTLTALGLDPDIPDNQRAYTRYLEIVRVNRLSELYCRTLEEFLISGLAVHRISGPTLLPGSERSLPRIDHISPENFLMDAGARDFRGWDATFLCQLHEVDFPTLLSLFARSPGDAGRLGILFRESVDPAMLRMAVAGFGMPEGSVAGLLTPSRPGHLRLFESWSLDGVPRYRVHDPQSGTLCRMEAADFEALPEEERGRLNAVYCIEKQWRYTFRTSTGEILAEGLSPYPDGGHPFIWKAYPYIDGEIHSFVDDIIDQQRFTNRLITMYDWLLRSSAKGVLLLPQEAIPAGADIDEIVDEWSKFNGVIMYRSKGLQQPPQQVSGNAAHSGIAELLNIQLNMFEEISGVNSALQGKLESSSTSGALFERQTRQSLTALSDLLGVYDSFVQTAALRLISE